jgi:adenosylcobinamide kinase/adenosylcobinamide-phosphate guanylyltransferase
MVNAVLTAELFLPGVTSLKERRRRLKSLLERLRLRFNVAAVEIDGQNTWQRATLAIAAVAGEVAHIHRVFQDVVDFIDGYREMMLSDYRVDLYGVYLGSEKELDAGKTTGGSLTLVTGGVRSGKSLFAESLVKPAPSVVFLATALPTDEEMAARIAQHRARRPASWETVEEPLDLGGAAKEITSEAVLLVDCLGVWVANLLAGDSTEAEIYERVNGFLRAVSERQGRTVAVTNEAGMGIVPPYPLGRLYRDILGRVNQQVAEAADAVYLLVCGIPVRIKP